MGSGGVIRRALALLLVLAAIGLGALFTVAVPASADQLCVGPGGTFVACGAPGQAPVLPGSASTPASSTPASSTPASSGSASSGSASSGSASSKPAASVPVPSGAERAARRAPSSSGGGVPGWADAIGIALIVVDLVALGAVLRSSRRRSTARRRRSAGSVAGRTGSAPTAGLS